MKKLLAVIVSIVLLCATASVIAEGADFIGMWYLHTVSSDGEVMDIASLGLTGSLYLDEEGHATMNLLGEENEGTWAIDSEGNLTVVMDDTPANAAIDGDSLVLSSDDMSMTFTREEASKIVMADRKNDADKTEFNGSWVCSFVSMYGITMDASALATEDDEEVPAMVFEDGVMHIAGQDISGIGEEDMQMEFKDGAFTYSKEVEGVTIDIEVYLLEDETLCMSMGVMGESIDFYFTRVADEATEPAA